MGFNSGFKGLTLLNERNALGSVRLV